MQHDRATGRRMVVLELLFPPVCIGCGVLLRSRAEPPLPLCTGCCSRQGALPGELRSQHGILACHPFQGPLATAMLAFKFSGRIALAGPLARLLARDPALFTSPISGHRWTLLVPVPLHPRRRLVRGYNQAQLLAARARGSMGPRRPPLGPEVLRRVLATGPQARLPASERPGNVAHAFRVPHPAQVRDHRILLIDDVTTTGATLLACKRALQEAGAREVGAIALLRTLA